MRRRNAKTVQFTAPTYFEASDVEYSTEEDEEGDPESYAQDEDGVENQNRQQDVEADDIVAIEPLHTREPLTDTQTPIDPRVDAPETTITAERSQSIDDDLDRIGMHLTLAVSNAYIDITLKLQKMIRLSNQEKVQYATRTHSSRTMAWRLGKSI